MSAQCDSTTPQPVLDHRRAKPQQPPGDCTALLLPQPLRLPANYGSCCTAAQVQLQQLTNPPAMATALGSSGRELADSGGGAKPRPQQQQPTQQPPKKATLLSLAAKTAQPARLEDIVRKGIDIAREFDASAFTGRPGVIKLLVADDSEQQQRRQSLQLGGPSVRFLDGRRQMSSPDDVVIEMPLDEPSDEVDDAASGGLDEVASRWRLRRQRNHSDSSKAPLMSDV